MPPGAYERTASQMLIDSLDDHHLTQMQREPTREKNVLDLYITNRPTLMKSINNVPNISDHEGAILVDSSIKPVYNKKKTHKYLLMSSAEWPALKEEVGWFTSAYLEHHTGRSVDDNWVSIKSAILNAIENNIPTRTSSGRNDQPWISPSIRRKCRKKHRMYKQQKNCDDPKKKRAFRSFKNSIEREIRHSRTEFVNTQVLGGLDKGNTKPFYKYVKSLKHDNVGLAPLKSGADLVTDSKQKAELLLEEFSSVFTQENTESIPWLGPAKEKIGKINITVQGVTKLLKSLKPHKASGPDRIPNRVLKEIAEEIAPAITALFTQSLEEGVIPEDWSNALITPVFKKGNVHSAANYRPVSLTCVLCKLLEHIVCSHVLTFMESNNLLTHLQHGFRKGHSCESQLIITMSDFFASFDSRIQTDVGVLDFSRAFDTVPHERLLGKLAHYGIQGELNEWIRAFLSNRQMRVVVDGEQSSAAPVDSGVPQGTVLGPLLFLVYINDMPNVVSPGTLIRLFADDCLVYRCIRSPEDQQILQRDLDNLQKWTETWGMRFNPAKCQVMHLARTTPVTKFYQLCGEILATVESAKYLGLTIQSSLSWQNQICSMIKKANSTLHLVARNLHNCSKSSRALAYTTLVRPKLEYCSSVWDPHHQKDIDALERVNRRAARVVHKKAYRQQDVSPTNLLKELGWQPLEKRREQQRLTMMYKISNGLVAVPPSQLVKPTRTLRGHNRKYIEIRTTCNTARFSFYVRTIRQWNNLSEEIVSAPTLDIFKTRLASAY